MNSAATPSSPSLAMGSALAPPVSGWLCLDKPAGMSSNLAMTKVRRIFYDKGAAGISKRFRDFKAGYIGTLDPFATGVLPIALGEARKFIPYVSEARKTYVFTMVFGSETDSLDVDGKVIASSDHLLSATDLQNVLPQFLGNQMQMPPKFSAIKINGRRACDLVREGDDVELQSRPIHIFSLELLNWNGTALSESQVTSPVTSATLKVVCSKGTYVRSLARDIAQKLGTVAFVQALRRTTSGPFDIKQAIPLEKLQKIEDTRSLMDFVMPLESPLDDIPALYLSSNESTRLQSGLIVFPNDGFRSSEDSKDAAKGESSSGDKTVLIFENPGAVFRGIGKLSDNGAVKAVRMCSPKNCF